MVSYTQVTVSGYNSSPPSDDGTQNASNQVLWATIKTKLGDPLKTAIDTMDDNIATAVSALDAAITAAVAAAALLTSIKTVDGSGSGLDADLLDGAELATIMLKANNLSDVASAATAFSNIKQAASDSATGVVELATAAEVVTGTDTGRVSPLSTMKNHEGVVKAWAYITNNGSVTLVDSYGVSGVVRDSEGLVTVSFSSNFANDDYAVVVTLGVKSGSRIGCIQSRAVGSVQILTHGHTDPADPQDVDFSVIVCGTLA